MKEYMFLLLSSVLQYSWRTDIRMEYHQEEILIIYHGILLCTHIHIKKHYIFQFQDSPHYSKHQDNSYNNIIDLLLDPMLSCW